MSLYQCWQRTWRPQHPALILPDGDVVTYAILDDRVRRAAAWLQAQGITAGDVVALQLPKHRLLLEVHLALMAIGAITLPMNPQYTAEEVRFLVADSGARLILLDDQAVDPGIPFVTLSNVQLDDVPPAVLPASLPPQTLAVLCYTSGTTGRPKGARIPQSALEACVDALHQAWAWTENDVLIHALPLFHIHGLFVAQHGSLRAGATSVWLERFTPESTYDAIKSQGGTIFMGVPTYYHRMLASPESPDLSSMRLFTSGSAPLAAQAHTQFRQRFGQPILERYGMTEVGIVVSNPLDGERRPGTVGFPLPGVQLRITDANGNDVQSGNVGEVRIAGPSVFEGYHHLPEATTAAIGDGWMHTGDLGHQDEDGYLHLVGRRADLILRGGMNVYPPEVEAAVLDAPNVTDVAVFGLQDPDLGERVAVAWAGTASQADIQLAAQRLAPFKRPVAFYPVAELPRNTMGKVQVALLRKRFDGCWIRRATVDDVDFLTRGNLALALETEALQLDVEVVRRGVSTAIEQGHGDYWIAEQNGSPVGQLMITTEWSDWRAAPVWWIQSVYVLPSARRSGILRALYDTVREKAAQVGVVGFRLYVDLSNVAAAEAYGKLGMTTGHYTVFEHFEVS